MNTTSKLDLAYCIQKSNELHMHSELIMHTKYKTINLERQLEFQRCMIERSSLKTEKKNQVNTNELRNTQGK